MLYLSLVVHEGQQGVDQQLCRLRAWLVGEFEENAYL